MLQRTHYRYEYECAMLKAFLTGPENDVHKSAQPQISWWVDFIRWQTRVQWASILLASRQYVLLILRGIDVKAWQTNCKGLQRRERKLKVTIELITAYFAHLQNNRGHRPSVLILNLHFPTILPISLTKLCIFRQWLNNLEIFDRFLRRPALHTIQNTNAEKMDTAKILSKMPQSACEARTIKMVITLKSIRHDDNAS